MESESYLRGVFEHFGKILSVEYGGWLEYEEIKYDIFYVHFENARNAAIASNIDKFKHPKISKIHYTIGQVVHVLMSKSEYVREMIGRLYTFFSKYGEISYIEPISDSGTSSVIFERFFDNCKTNGYIPDDILSFDLFDKRYTINILFATMFNFKL